MLHQVNQNVATLNDGLAIAYGLVAVAQSNPYARQQLLNAKRLYEVIVCTHIQSSYLIFFIISDR